MKKIVMPSCTTNYCLFRVDTQSRLDTNHTGEILLPIILLQSIMLQFSGEIRVLVVEVRVIMVVVVVFMAEGALIMLPGRIVWLRIVGMAKLLQTAVMQLEVQALVLNTADLALEARQTLLRNMVDQDLVVLLNLVWVVRLIKHCPHRLVGAMAPCSLCPLVMGQTTLVLSLEPVHMVATNFDKEKKSLLVGLSEQ